MRVEFSMFKLGHAQSVHAPFLQPLSRWGLTMRSKNTMQAWKGAGPIFWRFSTSLKKRGRRPLKLRLPSSLRKAQNIQVRQYVP